MQLLALTGAAPDHPVAIDALEGAYLKVAWLRVGGESRMLDRPSAAREAARSNLLTGTRLEATTRNCANILRRPLRLGKCRP